MLTMNGENILKFDESKQKIIVENILPATLINYIKNHLTKNSESIAVAESVTSGLFQLAFGTIEDASSSYQGEITAYNPGQKYRHLK